MAGAIINTMRPISILACLACSLGAAAQGLPDLGSTGDAVLSPQIERRIGESIVREIRFREPSYLDDPEIAEYLGGIGERISREMPGTRHDFEFFVLRDPTLNAFALPGGFMGVHTGLIAAAETESELASVIAHELAHVTQRHIARMLGKQEEMSLPVLAALAAAVLLGRARPDLAAGAAAAAQAGAVQATLAYSREFERDADRVGFGALEQAGFDPRAMAVFFERLQRAMRVADDGSVPGYLRTHPVTVERIADVQNKAAALPYRQHPDSVEFHLVRAKLRAQAGDARDAIAHFESAVRDRRYASEAAARYGFALALLRARRAGEAQTQLRLARAAGAAGPMVEAADARARQAQGDAAGAAALLEKARSRYPRSRALVYSQVTVLQDARRHAEALGVLESEVREHPRDPRLRTLQARSHAELGQRFQQHQAQAEVYALQGSLPAAIEQLEIARRAGGADFYQLSVVDARLKELRAQHAQEVREAKR